MAGGGIDVVLELRALREDQYRQVAEWEFGPQHGVDWPRYFAEMDAPEWRHCGLYRGDDFIGCISFEQINRQTIAYHVVTSRHKVRPDTLAQVLLKTVGFFFRRGFTSLMAHIPKSNTAAARLALRCGMREYGHTDKERRFILARSTHWKLNDA